MKCGAIPPAFDFSGSLFWAFFWHPSCLENQCSSKSKNKSGGNSAALQENKITWEAIPLAVHYHCRRLPLWSEAHDGQSKCRSCDSVPSTCAPPDHGPRDRADGELLREFSRGTTTSIAFARPDGSVTDRWSGAFASESWVRSKMRKTPCKRPFLVFGPARAAKNS